MVTADDDRRVERSGWERGEGVHQDDVRGIGQIAAVGARGEAGTEALCIDHSRRSHTVAEQVGVVASTREDVGHPISPVDAHEVHHLLGLRSRVAGHLRRTRGNLFDFVVTGRIGRARCGVGGASSAGGGPSFWQATSRIMSRSAGGSVPWMPPGNADGYETTTESGGRPNDLESLH